MWRDRIKGVPVIKSLAVVIAIAITLELGGIWRELYSIRREQVKNAAYSMAPERLARLKAAKNGDNRIRTLSGQVEIAGEVTVTTGLYQPLPVKVEDSFGDPIHVQASDPIPVQIER